MHLKPNESSNRNKRKMSDFLFHLYPVKIILARKRTEQRYASNVYNELLNSKLPTKALQLHSNVAHHTDLYNKPPA